MNKSFFILILLMLGLFVQSIGQSIKGTIAAGAKQTTTFLPNNKMVNNGVTKNNNGSYTLVPKSKNSGTTLLPNSSSIQPSKGQPYYRKLYPQNGNNNNTPALQQQNKENATKPLENNNSSLNESIDTTGFTRIPTLKTNPVDYTNNSVGFETVDTTKFLNFTNPPNQISRANNGLALETPDPSLLNKGIEKNGLLNSSKLNPGLSETVDTTSLFKNQQSEIILTTPKEPRLDEQVDVSHLMQQYNVAPPVQIDPNPKDKKGATKQNSITTDNKNDYKAQMMTGIISAKSGKSMLFTPVKINKEEVVKQTDTTKPTINVNPNKLVSNADAITNESNSIGKLDPLPSKEEIVNASIGTLDPLPPKEQWLTQNQTAAAPAPNQAVQAPKVDDFYQFSDGMVAYDTSNKYTLNNTLPTTNSSQKADPVETVRKVDEFYQFSDGIVLIDTTKVATNYQGQTFSGSFIPSKGKTVTLAPSYKSEIASQPVTFVKKNTNTSILANISIPPTVSNKQNIEPTNTAPTAVVTPTYPVNASDLKPTFYVTQNGKFSLSFSNEVFYINLSQTGAAFDYAIIPNNPKGEQYNDIKVSKNYAGLINNIDGIPIEYNYNHTVHKIGGLVIEYAFDDLIKKVGNFNVNYNSNGSVNKIDKYNVTYDYNNTVLKIDDNNGLIVFRPSADKRK